MGSLEINIITPVAVKRMQVNYADYPNILALPLLPASPFFFPLFPFFSFLAFFFPLPFSPFQSFFFHLLFSTAFSFFFLFEKNSGATKRVPQIEPVEI